MNRLASTMRSEKGIALPMALFGLIMMTALLLSFMSMAGNEPTIATNLTDVTQARYVADAGIESAFDQLATTVDWDPLLQNGGVVAAAGTQLPGLGNNFGTFAVTIRNDIQPGDAALTGQALDPSNLATDDTNGIVIVTASGTAQGVTRQIQVVVGRLQPPNPDAPLACTGNKCDFDTGTIDDLEGAHLHSDGRDHHRDGTKGEGPLKYAIVTPPGRGAGGGDDDDDDDDDEGGLSLEKSVENALNQHQLYEMDGKDEQCRRAGCEVIRWNEDTGNEGRDAIAADSSVSSDSLATFLQRVKGNSAVNMVDVKNKNAAVVVQDGVPSDPSINLGTVQNPTITWIKDSNGANNKDYDSLTLDGATSGAGILIVEDGSLAIGGNFRWDGIIIVTGNNVQVTFLTGGQSYVYGSMIIDETAKSDNHTHEVHIHQHVHGERSNGDQFTSFYASEENMDMLRAMPGLTRITVWREI